MRHGFTSLILGLVLVAACPLMAAELNWPQSVAAGSAFSVPTQGSGKAVLYVVGPGQALSRDVELGNDVVFAAGDISEAGHYLALLKTDSATDTAEFDVVPATEPASLSFLAKPSRLAVNRTGGISGVAYVFDKFHNLIVHPTQVSFTLSGAGAAQNRTATAHNGVAWVKMNAAPKAGKAEFVATAGDVSENRIIQQVPGNPCTIRMTAQRSGEKIQLKTDPVRDCNGNPVPDGTVVTFSETYHGSTLVTVDVPLKRDFAQTEMPVQEGAIISVASGVVMGNEITMGGAR
jgi:hypothetical protein